MLSTIRSKMKFIGVVLMALCTIGTGAGLVIAGSLSLSLSASGRINSVMRNHMEADMMHDALRSDVVSILLAAAEGRADVMAESRKDLSEHSTHFREVVSTNEQLVTDPALIAVLHDLSAPLEQYISSAQRIAALSSTDPAAARAALPGFKARFVELEGRMAAASDEIEATLATTTARGELLAKVGIAAMILIILISIGVSLALVRMSMRNVVAPIGVLDSEMAALAAGRTDVEMSSSARKDEIGAVGRSVLALQALIIRRAQTEAAAQEAQRAQAEKAERAIAESQAMVVAAMTEGMEHLALGDLTFRITADFPGVYLKLKNDFNDAAARLEEALNSVDGNAEVIRSGTHEMAEATDDLSRRTEQQAASLEEAAAALTEVTATVNRSAKDARNASEVVQQALEEAKASGVIVSQAVGAMDTIQASSSEMGQIISVIDEIAFQTNLLALNAGVEAARAGDAGRGFAVVASEVRELAQRSASAAKEINTLISKSARQVSQGVELVRLAGSNVDEIAHRVVRIGTLIDDMAAGSQEQATALQEINLAIGHMDQMTQQNAAMVEEATAASHSLANETETLSRSVGRFSLTKPDLRSHHASGSGMHHGRAAA